MPSTQMRAVPARERARQDDLERALEPRVIVRLLKSLLMLTDTDIAQATQIGERTVRRWKTADPGAVASQRLSELRNVILSLRETQGLTDRGIVLWLRSPNRLLEDYSPLAVIGAGGFRAARDAGLRFCDPDRPAEETMTATVLAALRKAERGEQASPTPKVRDRPKLTAIG
jgi:hypothetical protein